jgi:hypothetical protein
MGIRAVGWDRGLAWLCRGRQGLKYEVEESSRHEGSQEDCATLSERDGTFCLKN